MMEEMHVDDKILNCISDEFKSAKQISTELSLPYVRVSVRLKKLRRDNDVILMESNDEQVQAKYGIKRGIKPCKYKKRKTDAYND